MMALYHFIYHMPWVWFDGAAVSINLLVAFCSKNRAACPLALWLMASYIFSFATLHALSMPEKSALLAFGDSFLLWRFSRVWHDNPDVLWIKRPLTLLQLTAIVTHLSNIFTGNAYKDVYLSTLDVLFYLSMIVSTGVSVRNGLSLGNIIPHRQRDPYRHVMGRIAK